MKDGLRYHCNTCNKSYSVTVRTVFHKSKVDLQKWFYLIHILINTVDKTTVRDIGERIGVTKDTANRMHNQIIGWIKTNPNEIHKIIN